MAGIAADRDGSRPGAGGTGARAALFGYAAIACLLVGAIALVPRIAELVFRYLPLPSYPPLRLALGQLGRRPARRR